MKFILAAILLGLVSYTFAGDSVVLEFESPDSEDSDSGSSSHTSYNGLIIQVRQSTDEGPTIAIANDVDDYEDVYCLNFIGLFEASEYDTLTITNAEYTEIDDTRVDLGDVECTTTQESELVFSIQCAVNDAATLTLTFTFTQDLQGDYGLEYIIALDDYTLSDATAELVLVQSLKECGDLVDIDAEDTTEETEETEEEETEESTIDDPPTRRLSELEPSSTEFESTEYEGTEDGELLETEESEVSSGEDTESEESTDEESLEEEDGISEDDSSEFDAGFARLHANGQAVDRCDDGDTDIDSKLIYQKDDEELHIVFDPFKCSLILDPFYGLDESKYEAVFGTPESNANTPAPVTPTEGNAQVFSIFVASVIGLIACLW